MNDIWNEQERALLDALLDQIIPANPERNIPSAGSLGVAEFLATQVSKHPPFELQLRELLGFLLELGYVKSTLSVKSVQQLETTLPESFEALITHTYMGYYSRPDIRRVLGLSEQPVHPLGYEVPSETPEFLAELTSSVRGRGMCYRDI